MICAITPLFFIMLTEKAAIQVGRGQTTASPSRSPSPLASVQGIWPYISSIIGIIFITQLIINVVNFKLNLAVQNNLPNVVDKTVFFGKIYTLINIVSLLVQLIITPIALRTLSLRTNHLLIVGIYLAGLMPLLLLQGQVLSIISVVFIISKGVDYSFFGVIKEMLYYPLDEYQKYGAKYIIDIVMYRASKGVVSLGLTQIQNFRVLDALLAISTLGWLVLTFGIFRLRSQIRNNKKLASSP